jgi:hypothetical protein
MRSTSTIGIGFSSSVRAPRAAAVAAARFPQTPLSLGLSVFHARLAQRSTRDLACLS